MSRKIEALASQEPAAPGALSVRWQAQMVTARWPEGLGALLRAARRREGLSASGAAKALRRRLRECGEHQASGRAVREWERKSVAMAPWLLVEYLEALESPIEDWVAVLIELSEASGDPRLAELVREVSREVGRVSESEQKPLRSTLKEWVRLQSELVSMGLRMHLITGAIGELLPQLGASMPVLGGDLGTLMQRVQRIEQQTARWLSRVEGGEGKEAPEEGEGEDERS